MATLTQAQKDMFNETLKYNRQMMDICKCWIGGFAVPGKQASTFSAVMVSVSFSKPDEYIDSLKGLREAWVQCDASVLDLKSWAWCKQYAGASLSMAETKAGLDALVKEGNQQRRNAMAFVKRYRKTISDTATQVTHACKQSLADESAREAEQTREQEAEALQAAQPAPSVPAFQACSKDYFFGCI